MRKRVLSLLLALCLMLGVFPSAALAAGEALPFTDVKASDWYADAVKYVYEKGMMTGTSETAFSPGKATTRGMVVTVLHRMEGEPAASGALFPDVAADSYCAAAVAWASAAGIAEGYPSGSFAPNDPVTRQELAVILYRYIVYKGMPVAPAGDLSAFADMGQVSAYAREAMGWAVGAGIIQGVAKTAIDPNGGATRAQAAVMLMRLDEIRRSQGSGGAGTKPAAGPVYPVIVPGGNTPGSAGGAQSGAYSITGAEASGSTIVFTVQTAEACNLYVRILSDDASAEIFTASAEAGANLEQGTVSVDIQGTLPRYYRIEAVLKDSAGVNLSNLFVSRRYTKAQEEFDRLTVSDFDPDLVVNFDEKPNTNFGVLAEGVRNLSGAAAAENPNGSYTLTGLTETVAAGDVIYIPGGVGAEPVLIKVGSVSASGGAVTVTVDKTAALRDYYQVFKLDMEIYAGEPGGQTRRQRMSQVSYAAPSGIVRAKGDESVDTSYIISEELILGTENLHGSLKGESVFAVNLKIEYDVKLFGEDYYLLEGTVSTDVTITLGLEGAGVIKKDLILFRGDVPLQGVPCGSVYVEVKVPLKAQVSAGISYTTHLSSTQGVHVTPEGGAQIVSEKSKKENTLTPQGKAEVSVSLAAEAGIAILHEVLKLGINGGVGMELELAPDLKAGQESGSGYHACGLCLDGKSDAFLELNMVGSYRINAILQGDIIDLTLGKVTWDKKEFYYSLKNEGDSPFLGLPHIGDGKCPNWKYAVTLKTENAKGEATADTVTVTYGSTPAISGAAPFKAYLYNGRIYTAAAKIDGADVSTDFRVEGEARTVTLKARGGTVTGTVTDSVKQTAISGAAVTAVKTDDPSVTATATSVGNGLYTLNLLPGSYTVKASKNGYVTSDPFTITVASGETLRGRDIALQPGSGTVSGTVTDRTKHTAISGATVRLSSGDKIFTATTGSDGGYAIENVPAGSYAVTVSANGYGESSATVEVTSAGAAYDAELTQESGTLSGIVTGSDDGVTGPVPLEGAVITASQDGAQVQAASTGADGSYSMALGAGTYTVTVSKDGYGSKAQTLTITSGGSTFSPCLERAYGGQCGNFAYWKLESGVLTIYGTGNLYDQSYASYVGWDPYRSLIQKVVVEEGITELTRYAFENCVNLTSVTLPEGLTVIKDNTFRGCSTLAGVKLPESITAIGIDAFRDCTSLTRIVIPENVTFINNAAFMGCSSLAAVDMRGTFGGEVRQYTFADCTSLAHITIPDGVSTIGVCAFSMCTGLKTITIPKSLTAAYHMAFFGHQLSTVYYAGTEEEWAKVNIVADSGYDDNPLKDVTVVFSSTGP